MNDIEKNKGVRFIFELENGKELELDYWLQPNSLREKWIKEVKTFLAEKNSYLNLKLSNKNYSHINQLTEKLNLIINKLNESYDNPLLPSLNGIEDINRETLNHLHELFELYGENRDQLYRGECVHHLWLDLNEWIHITETAMESKGQNFPNYSALVTVYPPYPGKELNSIDKLFLSTEFSWGYLYLGYNTLGKDYMHASQDKDVRVIVNNQVKVQERYSSEVWLCFQEKSYSLKETECGFYRWFIGLTEQEKSMMPIEDLNQLALGRYYLGRIAPCADLLKFHPVVEDWYSDKNLQSKWNSEVFSKVKSIKKVKIVEY